ncbi:hypothetical protein [Micromonospora sp. NPDC049679]|uniref:hypothetical protein n=1 Tax=Micromonospora sp. NPDC049679 TaxID=3155920 RepID=UPI0033CC3C6A
MDKWEYGYLYFVQTTGKPDKGVIPPGPTVVVVADRSGHTCAPLKGRRLEVLNDLGAAGWMISDGYWTCQHVRWLCKAIKSVEGVESMTGYWQFFMRRPLAEEKPKPPAEEKSKPPAEEKSKPPAEEKSKPPAEEKAEPSGEEKPKPSST